METIGTAKHLVCSCCGPNRSSPHPTTIFRSTPRSVGCPGATRGLGTQTERNPAAADGHARADARRTGARAVAKTDSGQSLDAGGTLAIGPVSRLDQPIELPHPSRKNGMLFHGLRTPLDRGQPERYSGHLPRAFWRHCQERFWETLLPMRKRRRRKRRGIPS